MTDTTFVNLVTILELDWVQDVNDFTYQSGFQNLTSDQFLRSDESDTFTGDVFTVSSTTINLNGDVDLTGSLSLADNEALFIGTSNDINLRWDGTNFLIDYQISDTALLIRDVSNTTQFNFNIPTGGLTLLGDLTAGGATINFANLPTSAGGLSAGDLWNNAGVVNIV